MHDRDPGGGGAVHVVRRMLGLILACVLLVLLVVVAVAAGALWWSLPPGRMELRIAGLSAPVGIDFDGHGVPRIKASSIADATTALGFLHARDRMFQLELMRRAASGTLSAIAGPATLPLDRQMRTLGLARAARSDIAALTPETRALLAAYARGVNAWIAARGRFSAPEFIWFGAPEPWEDWHSLLWAKTMGLWLSENWRTELSRLALEGKLPRARIDELWPADQGIARPDELRHTQITPEQSETARAVLSALAPLPGGSSSASNEWAVDGRHSATGAPLLAGDPHLAYGFPGIWYLARIETPGEVLAGATAPGVPAVVIGHNGHIAWTFTTTGADVQDVFIETASGPDSYQTPDGPRPYTIHEERIVVRGQPDEILRVRETRHGPVISDIMRADGAILAVAMANLQHGDTAADGLLALNRARSMDEAGAAAPRIASPVQNLLVADRTRIGLFVTGRVPIRRAGDGRRPVMGADGAHDWVGWASGPDLPRYVDPEAGWLVNANERIAPAGFPVFLGHDWFGDWRARRIRALLEAREKHDVAGFAAMQVDATSAFAQQILPVLRAIPAPAGTAGAAMSLLGDWDGGMAMERPQPLIFNAWMRRFRRAVLDAAGVPAAAVSPGQEFIAFVLSPAGAHWIADRDAMLARTLQQAMDELAAAHGADPARWRWGDAHPTVFANPLLRHIPLLGWLSTFRVPSPGDASTVNRASPGADGFAAVHGAGYRGVYDLADLDRSRFIVAPGQSGHWLSRNAGDLALPWRDGDTIAIGPRADGTAPDIRLSP